MFDQKRSEPQGRPMSLRRRLSALSDGSAVPLRAPESVPDVRNRAVWDAVDGELLLTEATAVLARPMPVLTASAWARTFRDGVRTEYEAAAGQVRERVTLLVLAAVLD